MKHLIFCGAALFACSVVNDGDKEQPAPVTQPAVVILGTVQDGGSPHIGCEKDCCRDLFKHPDPDRMVVSLGLIDPSAGKSWLFEATPDIGRQLTLLNHYLPAPENNPPDGIFLTHAHIGHYTGLMYLGREALGAKNVAVHVLAGMKEYLEHNGPWSQLVELNNIKLRLLQPDSSVRLTENVSVTPFLVPHRDEFSETAGYMIQGPSKRLLFIPDIDKWEKWERSIVEEVERVDYALLDASFFDAEEINNRDISEIPHPFVVETMEVFDRLPEHVRKKIIFIHFNHTNPLLKRESAGYKEVLQRGYRIAEPKLILLL